ncbi:MAG: acyclic terpene utilization AtuA family protein [Sporichthyaceae bacterium]
MSTSERGTRPIRIANCSGFNGDRRSAITEILAGDPVDAIVGDYLAEVTLAAMVGRAAAGRGRAFAEEFLRQLDGNLPAILDRGIKVIVDAGAFDPAGLADEVRKMAAQTGHTVNVAHLEGDNLLERMDELVAAEELRHLETLAPFESWGLTASSANAYLGGWGIAVALAAGADVVICPRVTDASLVVGAAAWWHGWETEDWDRLAGAVVAGHIIECGPQATGGNFSGFTSIPGIVHPGFPIAEVDADGSCVITKHAGAGGAVTPDTVTAQLLYEIQGPLYLNPDVTADLRGTAVTPLGPDRVAVTGTVGCPPSFTTKVAITAVNGYENSFECYLTGLDIDDKATLVLAQARAALAGSPVEIVRVDQVGAAAEDPATMEAATVSLRIVGRCAEPEPLMPARFFGPVASTILSSIPGFHCESHTLRFPRPSPVVEYWPGTVSMSKLTETVVLDDGTRTPVPGPAVRGVVIGVRAEDGSRAPAAADTVRVPLGRVAHARSGDKGGNSNVGMWVQPAAWPWLRGYLTTARFRELFPEAAHLKLTRHEFPHLHAVHVVVHGNLGTGASSNGRLDALGKSVGEYLRARHVDVPRDLVPEQYR